MKKVFKSPFLALIFTFTFNSSSAMEGEIALTLEQVSNLRGGLERKSTSLGNFDFTLSLPNASQGEVFVYLLGTAGGDPSEFVGDMQTTSNIETNDSTKIYELWYRQYFFDETFSALAGLHDFNSVFYSLDNASLFLNASFGIGPEIAQAGPSIFSSTALGTVLSYDSKQHYLYFSAYDGVPGDPDNDDGTHIQFDKGDGIFKAVEAGWHGDDTQPYKIGIGLWHSSAEFDSLDANQTLNSNWGSYFLAETLVGKRLQSFIQIGYADPDKNRIARYVGIGSSSQNVFMRDDQLGLGLAHACVSKAWKTQQENAVDCETAVELSYALVLSKHLSLQPDLQYIVHPGADGAIDNALVVSLRLLLNHAF